MLGFGLTLSLTKAQRWWRRLKQTHTVEIAGHTVEIAGHTVDIDEFHYVFV